MKLENNRYENGKHPNTARDEDDEGSELAGREGEKTAAATFNCKRGAFIEVSKRSRIEREAEKEEETEEK